MILVIFGKQYENYFSSDVGFEMQEELMNYLSKEDWKKIIHQQSKYYYWNDLKYIIPVNKTANHKCKKDKIHSYQLYVSNKLDMKVCNYQEIVIPLDVFPPINEYHDMRLINRSVFYKKDYSIEILSITHQHNDNVTYEIHLCGEDFEKMLPVVKFLSKNYKLVDDKKINHPGRFVLSVL
jgi:hypothetical protein